MPIDPKLMEAMVEAACESLCNTQGCTSNGFCEFAPCQCVSKAILAAIRAAEAWPVPHKLVGREATGRMISAACDADDQTPGGEWHAMFEAAPGVGE